MGDFKSRFSSARSRLLRRASGTSARSTTSSKDNTFTADQPTITTCTSPRPATTSTRGTASSLRSPRKSSSVPKLRDSVTDFSAQHQHDEHVTEVDLSASAPELDRRRNEGGESTSKDSGTIFSRRASLPVTERIEEEADSITSKDIRLPEVVKEKQPIVTIETPTPDKGIAESSTGLRTPSKAGSTNSRAGSNLRHTRTLVGDEPTPPPSEQEHYFAGVTPSINDPETMVTRKIWVKRPTGSPTLVQIKSDDLVDDVRDMILRKYANSLGRTYDSPDMTIRIVNRHGGHGTERTMGPEEDICKTLDLYFPDGQKVDDALIIEVPQRSRTPRPSPRAPVYYYADDPRPLETSGDYFGNATTASPGVLPIAMTHSPALPFNPQLTSNSNNSHHSVHHHLPVNSMQVVGSGILPNLPSPGGTRRGHHRPKNPRQMTSSPISASNSVVGLPTSGINLKHPSSRQKQSHRGSDASEHPSNVPPAPPLPTPPAPEAPPTNQGRSANSPTPRVASPRPGKPKKPKKPSPAPDPMEALTPARSGLLDGSVPPINVLIVEDNIINLKLLEAFMKRLKVRWQTAMNGRDAVVKWRQGGFHLVLMDIQLPIMSGLEATKEIRRLERVNNIGVFNSTVGTELGVNGVANGETGLNGNAAPSGNGEIAEGDKLKDRKLFKSPVIIVALTASSLQSDRHEALAAGCNDFLTKPVLYVWLERKVKEWGCMQALIDFDGWRKWKDLNKTGDDPGSNLTSPKDGESKKKKRESMSVRRTEVLSPVQTTTLQEEVEST